MENENSKECLLIVDDSVDTRELLRRNLESQGYTVLTAPDVTRALTVLGISKVDLVITDLKLPGVSGLELIRHVRENMKDTEVIMITGYPSVEGAVAAVKTGAEEYLPKPFTKEELLASVNRALEKLRLRSTGRYRPGRPQEELPGIIGESEAMRRVSKAAAFAFSSNAPLLLMGEQGTGKGTIARAIHAGSRRSQGLFIQLVASGIAEDTLARQLFGPVVSKETAGPFGCLKAASGGTLYLAELTDLPSAILSLLFQGSPEAPGPPADVHLIAATHKDLRSQVLSGSFPEDIFVRLSMNCIPLPPLRDRGDDILLLARHFTREAARDSGKPEPAFTDRALDAMRHYRWPGNVVELANVARDLAAAADQGVIDVTDLPACMRYSAAADAHEIRSLAEVEFEHIQKVMTRAGGNKTRAAEILGINRKTLRDKLKQIAPPAAMD